jgi:hypothetical protein
MSETAAFAARRRGVFPAIVIDNVGSSAAVFLYCLAYPTRRSPSINAPPWKASPASIAARGYSEALACRVSAVFENLQDMSVDELVEEFGVTREVQAVLQFAAQTAEAADPRA